MLRKRTGDGVRPGVQESKIRAAVNALDAYRGVAAFIVVFALGVIFSPRALDNGRPIFLSFRTQLDILY